MELFHIIFYYALITTDAFIVVIRKIVSFKPVVEHFNEIEVLVTRKMSHPLHSVILNQKDNLQIAQHRQLNCLLQKALLSLT